jgi:hypothetical protein
VNAQALPASVIGELQVQWKFPQVQPIASPGSGFSELLASVTESQVPPEGETTSVEVPQQHFVDQKDPLKDLLALAVPETPRAADALDVSAAATPVVGNTKRAPAVSFVSLGSHKSAQSVSKPVEDVPAAERPCSVIVAFRIIPVSEEAVDFTPAMSMAPVETEATPQQGEQQVQANADPAMQPALVQNASLPVKPARNEEQALQSPATNQKPTASQQHDQVISNDAPAIPPRLVRSATLPVEPTGSEEQKLQSPAPNLNPTAAQQHDQVVSNDAPAILPRLVRSATLPEEPTGSEEQTLQSPAPDTSPKLWEAALAAPAPSLQPPAPQHGQQRTASKVWQPAARDESVPPPKAMPAQDEQQTAPACQPAPILQAADDSAPRDAPAAATMLRKGPTPDGRMPSLRTKPGKPAPSIVPLPIDRPPQPSPAASMPVPAPPAVGLPRVTAKVETMPVELRQPRTVENRYSQPQSGFLKPSAATDDQPTVQTAFGARLVAIDSDTAADVSRTDPAPQVEPRLVPPDKPAASLIVEPKRVVTAPVETRTDEVSPVAPTDPPIEEKTKIAERPHRPDNRPDQSEAIAPKPEVRTASLPLAAGLAENSAPSRPAESRPADSQPVARPAEIVPPSEVAETPASVRDIRLQFTADEGRIQVRMAERGGEVRVTVHTADQNVAGALRADLPSLSGRLEQAGFHSETWHGSGAQSAEPTLRGESPSGMSQQDTPEPGQQNPGRQQQEQQQERRAAEEKQATTKRSDDFSWLFESLR